ncbi:MAG: hypothetical protein IID37_13245, partial [Planctomycetes bacterium]|nr:hypothetical protein [Planctomycetota bacterium]
EVEQAGDSDTPAPARRRRRGKRRNPFAASQDRFYFLGPVVKMVYVAVILTVLIVVGRKYILPAVLGQNQQQHSREARSKPKKTNKTSTKLSTPDRGGLLVKLDAKKSGIYVDSVPEGARIYIVDPAKGVNPKEALRILQTPACDRNERARAALDVQEGSGYLVLCTLPINARGLKKYPGYRALRERVEAGAVLTSLDEFLLPDKAHDTGTVEFRDDFLLYRLYRVDVAPKQWSPVIALFIPHQSVAENSRYLPKRKAFTFDKAEANSEMDFYGFPPTDQSFLIQSLESIGAMVYHLERDGEDLYYWLRVPLTEGVVKIRRLPRT